jgi:membrane associated rhomboid family serine protease
MFLPLHDRNPLRIIPFQRVTVGLIVVCVVVFLWQQSLPGAENRTVMVSFGLVPAVLLGATGLPPDTPLVPAPLTVLTAMFLHGGWMHLVGNMLFLWVFGDNVEDSMGHGRFIVFYLLCGIAASGAHVLSMPDSTLSLLGASGAIAGVLGAYLVLHPRVKVLVLVFHRFPLMLPAYLLLGLWLMFQLSNAWLRDDAPVAWSAHIGGFIAGAILIVPFRYKQVPLFDRGLRH